MWSDLLLTIILTVISIFVLSFGILLVVSPSVLVKIIRAIDVVIGFTDVSILAHRWIWGTLFLLASAYIFYIVFTYDLPLLTIPF